MFQIILLILKIIGIVALSLLGLLLAVLLLVLLVPVRYSVRGSYHKKPQGMARITWLLHIVSVTASYEEDFVMMARIFGFPVMKPVNKDEEETEDFVVQAMENVEDEGGKAAREILKDMELSGEEREMAEKTTSGKSEKSPSGSQERSADQAAESSPAADSSADDSPADGGTADKGESPEKSGPFSRLFKFLSKLKFSFSHICDKLKNISENMAEKKDGIQEWITNEENRNTIRLLLRQAKKLVVHILPRKGRGKVVFGFEDPYITGQALTYLSVIYPFCHRHMEFLPIFDSDGLILEADGNFRGRIRLGTLFAIAARVLLNKNFRVILKRWMR